MKRLKILTTASVLLAACIFFLKKRNATTITEGKGLVIDKRWLVANSKPVTAEGDGARPADQTFLTYPEWYLVFSPEEQAAYFKHTTATSFPFMRHTAQIWQGYKVVSDQIKGNFPYNGGYNFMIWVIGSSATVEYSIKAWYETVIGRITDTKEVVTDEDKFNARFTQDYVDFIKDKAWYEFDFYSSLSALWSGTSFWGGNFLRKIERKYILTSELLVKAGYAKLIKLGTKTIYSEAFPTTAVVINKVPADSSGLIIMRRYNDGSALLFVHRYDKFNPVICNLAERGCSFREIAGNNSAILLTVLVPVAQNINMQGAKVVFTQPLASNLSTKRVALAIPVPQLHKLLLQLISEKVFIEHVFDY